MIGVYVYVELSAFHSAYRFRNKSFLSGKTSRLKIADASDSISFTLSLAQCVRNGLTRWAIDLTETDRHIYGCQWKGMLPQFLISYRTPTFRLEWGSLFSGRVQHQNEFYSVKILIKVWANELNRNFFRLFLPFSLNFLTCSTIFLTE